MEKKYCIYKHVSPEGKIYIGQTSRKPIERWNGGHGYRSAAFQADILRFGGPSHFIESFEHYYLNQYGEWVLWNKDATYEETNLLSLELADMVEKAWIFYYGGIDSEMLYNEVSGGHDGFQFSQAARERSAAVLSELYSGEGNPFFGKHHSEETRKKLSEYGSTLIGEKNPFYGHHHTEEVKEKNRQAHLGKYVGENATFWGHHHTAETKALLSELRNKPVNQYDLKGKFIRCYQSASFAADAVGVSVTTISDAATCKIKYSARFQWRYKSEEFPEGRDIDTIIDEKVLKGKGYKE